MAHLESRVSAVDEFKTVDLGDVRREKRLRTVVGRLIKQPDAGFPRAMRTEADLEGFYRFLANEAITFEALLQPHIAATAARVADCGEALVVHDTSQFRYRGDREGLGRLMSSGHGFLGHLSLAVTSDGMRSALGVLAVEVWARQGESATALRKSGKLSYEECRALPNEQDVWLRSVEAAEAAAGKNTSLIHIMDSEADDYDLMADLVERGRRWVLRLSQDRVLSGQPAGTPPKVRELIATREVVCTREVRLSARRRQEFGRKRQDVRHQRDAKLAISAASVVLRRPAKSTHAARSLAVNIVAVREIESPPGLEPVEWLLVTTDPIATEAQLLKVVDSYRARWVIEEYFKALKTGCAIEKRQLESLDTLKKALAIFIPIAWSLLQLRSLARREERNARAGTILTPLELKVLGRATKQRLSSRSTIRKVMLAIARLGGHHHSNGEPGWQVLGAGYQDLLMMIAGYRLATANGEK